MIGGDAAQKTQHPTCSCLPLVLGKTTWSIDTVGQRRLACHRGVRTSRCVVLSLQDKIVALTDAGTEADARAHVAQAAANRAELQRSRLEQVNIVQHRYMRECSAVVGMCNARRAGFKLGQRAAVNQRCNGQCATDFRVVNPKL